MINIYEICQRKYCISDYENCMIMHDKNLTITDAEKLR